jgi:hypothetical protein
MRCRCRPTIRRPSAMCRKALARSVSGSSGMRENVGIKTGAEAKKSPGQGGLDRDSRQNERPTEARSIYDCTDSRALSARFATLGVRFPPAPPSIWRQATSSKNDGLRAPKFAWLSVTFFCEIQHLNSLQRAFLLNERFYTASSSAHAQKESSRGHATQASKDKDMTRTSPKRQRNTQTCAQRQNISLH